MKTIRPEMFTNSFLTFDGDHSFSVDASEMGITVFFFPTEILVAKGVGNGLSFMHSGVKRNPDGEILWVDYTQANGLLKLRVYND